MYVVLWILVIVLYACPGIVVLSVSGQLQTGVVLVVEHVELVASVVALQRPGS